MGNLVLIGGTSLGALLPGLSGAVSELQSSVAQLTGLKADKDAATGAKRAEVASLGSLVKQAQDLVDEADALLGQVQDVMDSANTLLGDLSTSLGAAGVSLYRYDGEASGLGSALSAQLGGTSTILAMITVASDGGAISAVQSVFKGS